MFVGFEVAGSEAVQLWVVGVESAVFELATSVVAYVVGHLDQQIASLDRAFECLVVAPNHLGDPPPVYCRRAPCRD